jgi:mRNA interferase MazF
MQRTFDIGCNLSMKIGLGQKWMCTMQANRGDVVLVLFPDSNLRTAKRRPVLVVQADNLQTGLQQVIVAMISSNMSRAGHDSRVSISKTSPNGQQMGLRTDSVVMTDNLATILECEIDQSIGKCRIMHEVDKALRNTLAL